MSAVITIKEDYGSLVPKISGPEYNSLKQNIEDFGQRVPIIINSEGVILDGHHRYKICQELGIEPKTFTVNQEDVLNEKLFVIDCNLERRQLNSFQRTELALKAKPILEEIARKNESLGGKGVRIQTPLGRVDVEIGKRAGVGKDTVRRVEKILENKDDDLKEKARKGQFTVNEAFNKIKRSERRTALLNEVPQPSLRKGEQDKLKLLLGNFVEESKNIADNSIDLIFTDPPYGENSIPLHHNLAVLASRVLREGGSLVTYVRQFSLPEVFHQMLVDSGLRYWWTFAVKHTGNHQLIYSRNVFVEWKPLVWFVKGEKPMEGLLTKNIGDLIESKPPDKSLHKWAQSTVEAEFVIDNLTIRNQTILDPFMGAGNFVKAALKLERKFIGIEENPETFELAKANIAGLNS